MSRPTYTPSPSPNISTRSLNKLSFIHLIKYRIVTGESSVVLGNLTVCFGLDENKRCRPPL